MDALLSEVSENVIVSSLSSRMSSTIGIGTDLDGGYGTEQTPMDLDSIADLQTIPGLLSKRGYSEEDINKVMAFNVIDFLRRAWGE